MTDDSEESDDEVQSLLEVSSLESEPETAEAEDESEWEYEGQELSFKRVLLEERELLLHRRLQRGLREEPGAPFSLAFSGGGIRAAAFQAGVLWRLAEAGRLKDVEYFTAVSGGGYIAASYASHLLSAEKPTDPSEVDRWFRDVVARTICRMQRNAGDFVRDCVAAPGVPEDGAGCCPRLCDLPLLLLMLFVTLWTNPLIFMATVLLPVVEAMEIFFGPVIRAAFCESDDHIRSLYHLLMQDRRLSLMGQALAYLIVVSFLIWLVSLLPFLHGKAARVRPRCFLLTQSALAASIRCTFALVLFLTLVIGTPYIERLRYSMFQSDLGGPSRHRLCISYVCANSTATSRRQQCEDGLLQWRRPWVTDFCSRIPSERPSGLRRPLAPQERPPVLLSWLGTAVLVVAVGSVVLMPCFPWLPATVVLWLGPIAVFIFGFLLLQFRVFGPMTGQHLLHSIPYDSRWSVFVGWASAAGLAAALLSDYMHGFWHWYYKRCLKTNFFDGGLDRTWDELRANAYCPFLIMTGTVNDFMRPTDRRSISEISFSPLHVGSLKCGYVRTLPFGSLAQTTALTGAGCLDALTLSMSNKIRMRIWLEVLNLGWGDFILFRPSIQPGLLCLARLGGKWVMEVLWHLYRAPAMALWSLAAALFAGGWLLLRHPSEANCRGGGYLLLLSIGLAVAMILLSFFSFLDCLGWLMYSPTIRRLQEASRFYFRGLTPPGMLYVTDGGVQDCTAIMQLMRRRCERILLVLAASDPTDDLGVLRATMDLAVANKLGCFYDPKDPRRDVKILLDEFKKDLSIPYIHLSIRYGWDCPREAESFGRLIVVKNRLPEAFGRQRVRPLLSEEEVRGGQGPEAGGEWGELLEEDLGGFGCCDCCHRRCRNLGRKFPHLSVTGYTYLTPQLFSSLARLGHGVSEAGVLAATSPGEV